MKTKNFKLAEQMLRKTITFEINQVDYLIDLSLNHIIVWSIVGRSGTFHSTEIIALFNLTGFSTYIQYNAIERRCELVIFLNNTLRSGPR